MSYWDSSALVKLYVQELDSEEFRELAVKTSRVATGSLTRHEVRTVFRRREAEGVLPSGEGAALYEELTADIAAADIVIQPDTADLEREFGAMLEACFSQTPPTFIRN
jgi:predicted nucleic acid-binding protein